MSGKINKAALQKLKNDPGTKWSYANFGYMLAIAKLNVNVGDAGFTVTVSNNLEQYINSRSNVKRIYISPRCWRSVFVYHYIQLAMQVSPQLLRMMQPDLQDHRVFVPLQLRQSIFE